MTILKTDTVSGIGTEGTIFEGDITFDSLNYMTLPKGTTTQSNKGRALFGGGSTPTPVNTITYILIQSSGRTIDFGDLTHARYDMMGCSSGTRGVFGGGRDPAGNELDDTIDYVTIATTGNATDFGDLRFNQTQRAGTGNRIRGIFGGGYISPTGRTTLMEQIEIATTGNATPFGDLTVTTSFAGATSDSHGGLSE